MKIISIDFVVRRAKATRDVQTDLAAPPLNWLWRLPVLTWNDNITVLDQLESAEILKRTQWRNAAEAWQADLDVIKEITRDVAGFGPLKFHANPVLVTMFDKLKTAGRSRVDIYKQGKKARDAWAEADPAWVIKKEGPDGQVIERTLGAFGSLLASSESKDNAHGAKETAWRKAVSAQMNKVRDVNADCVGFYEEATRYFPAGTPTGDTIRSTIPTTYRPEEPVGQAEIFNVIVSADGDIHFDCRAEHATKFTYLHRAPGQAAFVVVVTDSPEAHLTLHNQPPGVHDFKAIGSNSRGEGEESAVVSVTVAQAGVA